MTCYYFVRVTQADGEEMKGHAEEFSGVFGFRTEACEGSMEMLTRAWAEAKSALGPTAR